MRERNRTMQNTKYNGWSNYETWAANMWIEDDEDAYIYWTDQAKLCDPHSADDAYALAKQLHDHHDDVVEELKIPLSLATDLLSSAMSTIDWLEVAKSLIIGVNDNE